MPGKPARRRAAVTRPKAEAAGDSAIARTIDRAFENPAMSGGLMVMTITAMAIVSNALFLQAGRHPEPLFATRPAAALHAPVKHTAAMPLPRAREPAPVVSPAPIPTVAAPAPVDDGKALVSAVQRELARLGLYTGSIDGLMGPQTKSAISDWQTAAGIKVSGQPTPDLLAALRQPVTAVPPAPAPVPAVVKDAVSTDQVAAAVKRAEELEREQTALTQEKQLRKVQLALSNIGYGPLVVDGQANPATSEAIRGFQLDNGLPVTGALDDKLIARLISIGAMKAE